MSQSREHAQWAERHYQAARGMTRAHEYSWAAVALFYAGLHLVHAVLPVQGEATLSLAQQHPESHVGRTPLAEGTCEVVRKYFPDLNAAYRSLYEESIDVRYQGKVVTEAEEYLHRDQDLAQLGRWACQHLHDVPDDCWMARIG